MRRSVSFLVPAGNEGPVGATNPFQVLGLPERPDLTDDDVRAAWRRIAAATHPDRADGGDPVRYAAAADAYARLRTTWERGEVLADHLSPDSAGRATPRRWRATRPGMLAIRLVCAAGVSYLCYAAIGWAPATPAIITGAVSWLVLTGRRDLAAGSR